MKVLVADDSLVIRRLLESCLAGWGYEVVSVADGGGAWAELNSGEAPAIAILDWVMPVHSGLDLCRMLRAEPRQVYTYVILLTAKGTREDIVEGLGAGADDYIVKPFDRYELEVRLRAGRRIIDLQAELLRTQEALREQATRDALTRLWNRRAILEILAREVDRASRERSRLGVLMFDLDHFKAINDTYGHQCGDAVLSGLAERVQGAMRSYDAIGRYGGEEFLVVAPHVDEEALPAQARRLKNTIASSLECGEGRQVQVTASFGAAIFDPLAPCTGDALIRAADSALYAAKGAGRNAIFLSAAGGLQRVG
jgi:diguanylate cyclase (GGDEF)-like protein